MGLPWSLDYFLLFGCVSIVGEPEKAGMLAKSWDSWLFRSLSGLCGAMGVRKVQA